MNRRALWWSGVALFLAVGLTAGGCSKQQVREEGGVTQAPGGAEAGRAGTGAGSLREQNLSSTGSEAGRASETGSGSEASSGSAARSGGAAATPPEAPPKELAGQVEKRGPDVLKATATGGVPGAAEAIPGMTRVYFDFDQSALTAEAKATLEKNAKFLVANPGLRVRIEGHCDERGTTEYNIALGERRAKATFQYLMDLGVDPNRMGVMSYGKEVPADLGHNEEAWARNRRAEFVKFQ